jgi:hypothetical protein
MIASHSLIDNQSLHAMDTYIHGSCHSSARHGSALSAVPRRLAWTLLTAVALFTMPSILIHCPYFNYALIIIILLHSIFPLNCLHCNCLIHPSFIFIYVLCNAYFIIYVLSSTTASILLLYSSFVMSLLLLSYLILYSTLPPPPISLSPSLSYLPTLSTPLPVT